MCLGVAWGKNLSKKEILWCCYPAWLHATADLRDLGDKLCLPHTPHTTNRRLQMCCALPVGSDPTVRGHATVHTACIRFRLCCAQPDQA